jgi:hypothetical protein
MKRGFLFGLGSFLILGVLLGLVDLFRSQPAVGVILMLILMPLSVVTIRAANAAPPHFSRLHAVVGWLIGFFCIDAVILAVVGIILVAKGAL